MNRKEKGLHAPAPSKIPEMPKTKAFTKELEEIKNVVERIEIEEGKKYILSIKVDGIGKEQVIQRVYKLKEMLEERKIDTQNIIFVPYTDSMGKIDLIKIPDELVKSEEE